MKPVERLEASFAGERVDRFPFAFYQRLPLQHCEPPLVAEAVNDFVELFDVDLAVVPHVYAMPVDANLPFSRVQDFGNLTVVHARNGGWGKQMMVLSKVARACFQKRWVIQEMPCAWTVLEQLGSPELVEKALQENPGALRQALAIISESLASFARGAVEAGAQGVLYRLAGSSFDLMEVKQYEELLLPFDQQVLKGIPDAPCNIVQLVDGRQQLASLAKLPVPGLGWEVGGGPPLLRSRSKWTGLYYGGLEAPRIGSQRSDNLLRETLADHPPSRLIVAPDGPLSVSLRMDVLQELSHALQHFYPGPRIEPPRPPKPEKPKRPRMERPPEAPPKPLELPKGVRTRLRVVEPPPAIEEPTGEFLE